MTKLTDKCPLPVKGPYHGVAMANVPADYLLHLKYLRADSKADGNAVLAYIEDNADVLEQELQQLKTLLLIDTEDAYTRD